VPADAAETAHAYPLPDLTAPQLTVRAIVTGAILGGVLSLCNVYMGLKIGWGFNMSITAALLSYGFYQAKQAMVGGRPWGKLENNINQTAASSAASISSAGLVAPIPALTLLTGQELALWQLILWTLSVSLVGVVVAVGLRRQMLIVDNLPFPAGLAAGETLNEMYARGSEAMARVKALLAGALAGAGMKLLVHLAKIPNLTPPGAVGGASLQNLTFQVSPSPLFLAVGALIGIRAGLSLLLGAVAAWLVIGPAVIDAGWATGGEPDRDWFKELVTWLLWPGVAMMVTASLTSFAFSWRSVLTALRGTGRAGDGGDARAVAGAAVRPGDDEVPRAVFKAAVVGALVASVVLQFWFFGIGWGLATFGVLLTFVLAVVAGRVSGETGITPVGPMGKVTQLTFGALDSGNVHANLMAANVTGGAASQCADLLHDLKTGLLVGASPRQQTYAQFFGVLAGAICGSLGYLVLVGDAAQLGAMWEDKEWAMPAVVQWKAVAELFSKGVDNLPAGAVQAMLLAGALGIALAVAEKLAPKGARRVIPSPTGLGLAFVIPAYYSVSMALGAVIAWALTTWRPAWSARFLIVIAAGVVAGDSLTGVGLAVLKILGLD
jgi:OPT family oligopeptide transporter